MVKISSYYTFLKSSEYVEDDKNVLVEKYCIFWHHGAMQDNGTKSDPPFKNQVTDKNVVFSLFSHKINYNFGLPEPINCVLLMQDD